MHGPSTSCTHAVLTWPVEVQVTGQLFICVTCIGKAVVDTVMDWLEVEELQLDKLLGGWRGCLCQCCVHQVPITDHHPIFVEGHSEVITCVSGAAADVEGSSSVEVVADVWVSSCRVAWPHSRRRYQTRYQREACQSISGQSMINLPKSYVYSCICEQITVCHGVCACAYNTVTRCVVISELVMPWSLPILADRITLLHIRHLPIRRVCPTIYTHHWSCRLWPFTPQLNLLFHVHACTQAYYLTQYQKDEAFLYTWYLSTQASPSAAPNKDNANTPPTAEGSTQWRHTCVQCIHGAQTWKTNKQAQRMLEHSRFIIHSCQAAPVVRCT